jgi:hypothetical protein
LVPEDPEVPFIPEVPEVPFTPEVPEVPFTPEVPEVPFMPEDPDVPEVPEVPDPVPPVTVTVTKSPDAVTEEIPDPVKINPVAPEVTFPEGPTTEIADPPDPPVGEGP